MREFRPARAEDAQDLSAVSNSVIEADARFEGGPSKVDSVPGQPSMMDGAEECFVIEDGRRIIGGMVIVPHGMECQLSNIFIDPEYQGKGVGRAALEFLFDRYPWATRWFLQVPDQNTRAPFFFEAMGFHRLKKDDQFYTYEKTPEPVPDFDFDRDWYNNPAVLRLLVERTIPFGKYAGRVLADLPEDYLLWFEQKGWPQGNLGRLMALMLEIRKNGLEGLLDPLR